MHSSRRSCKGSLFRIGSGLPFGGLANDAGGAPRHLRQPAAFVGSRGARRDRPTWRRQNCGFQITNVGLPGLAKRVHIREEPRIVLALESVHGCVINGSSEVRREEIVRTTMDR